MTKNGEKIIGIWDDSLLLVRSCIKNIFLFLWVDPIKTLFKFKDIYFVYKYTKSKCQC